MKKNIVSLLVLLLMIGMTACVAKKTQESKDTSQIKIGIIQIVRSFSI